MEVLHYLSGVMDFPYYEDHLEIDAVALLALAILILVHRLAAVRAHVLEHLELEFGVVRVLLAVTSFVHNPHLQGRKCRSAYPP